MDLKLLQKEIRLKSATIINHAKASHIGGVFSSADILAVLYGEILEKNKNGLIDSFILSKGHCCAGVYSALHSLGFISDELLDSYGQNESPLMAHISHKVNTVEFSTGSLGHGLPFAVGKAIASQNKQKNIYVLLSDGEMDEGSNWEAIHFAGFHKLNNLTAIIDYNKYQSLATTFETLDLEPIVMKIESFNWNCIRCNGHDLNQLKDAFNTDSQSLPKMIICDTQKGYPIDFMMNKVIWHYKPPSKEELDKIKHQLNIFYQ